MFANINIILIDDCFVRISGITKKIAFILRYNFKKSCPHGVINKIIVDF